MRVKIKEKPNVPHLNYGKTYELLLASCDWSYRFTFTRKNYVLVTEMNHSKPINNPYKMTKKELKQLVTSDVYTDCVQV